MGPTVTIIGAGDIGTALAKHMTGATKVILWDVDPKKCVGAATLKEAVSSSTILFFCVPSWNLRHAATDAAPSCASGTVVVSLSKGIEKSSLKTSDAVLSECLPMADCAVLGGPLLARELKAGLPGVGVLAGSSRAFEAVKKIFFDSAVTLLHHPDTAAVALCGVLKNVYAIAIGVVDGLELGSNARGYVAGQALQEMQKVLTFFGKNPALALSVAAAGDFIATAFSPHSRNRSAGEDIARRGICCITGEGIESVPSLQVLCKEYLESLPLFRAIAAVVANAVPPRQAFQKFFSSSGI